MTARIRRGRATSPDIIFVEATDLSVEFHFLFIMRKLVDGGNDVHVMTRDTGRLERIAKETGVATHPQLMERNPSPWKDAISLIRMLTDLRTLSPRSVVYATPKGALLASISSRLARVPKRVYVVMGLRAESSTGLSKKLLLALERIAVRNSTHVVAVGPELRELLKSSLVAPGRVDVIGHGSAMGVDTVLFAPADEPPPEPVSSFGLDPTSPIVGFVGRVAADKGIDVLLAAMDFVREQIPRAQLLIVGPLEDFHEERILNTPRTALTGDLKNTAPVYQLMDVLCLPSRREGLPTVLLEAAASGVPIVASAATGVKDVIANGTTGLVVRIDDIQETATAILAYLLDPPMAREMAQRARADVTSRFSREFVVDSATAYYRAVLDDSLPHQLES
tara:strand:+ start:4220 stop:5398 length:1179 start_codon:yes stop_codon:yes gene_type:complete